MDDHIQDKLKEYESRLFLANEEILRLKDMETRLALVRGIRTAISNWLECMDADERFDVPAGLTRKLLGDLDAALDEEADDE